MKNYIIWLKCLCMLLLNASFWLSCSYPRKTCKIRYLFIGNFSTAFLSMINVSFWRLENIQVSALCRYWGPKTMLQPQLWVSPAHPRTECLLVFMHVTQSLPHPLPRNLICLYMLMLVPCLPQRYLILCLFSDCLTFKSLCWITYLKMS